MFALIIIFGVKMFQYIPRTFSAILLLASAWHTMSFAETPRSTDFVAQLYQDYNWETKEQPTSLKRHTLQEESQKILAHYFDENLTALLLKDKACVKKTKEVCKLDFSPIWASQDPTAFKNLNISPAKEENSVIVELNYQGEAMKLTYRLLQTKVGWRIKDIEYDKHASLVSTLSK
jgi:hypothetical protein